MKEDWFIMIAPRPYIIDDRKRVRAEQARCPASVKEQNNGN